MMTRSSKPPLPRSPIRLRSRRVHHPSSNALQTPPGSLTKSRLPIRQNEVEDWEIRPEYQTISCELRALAKMVQQEIGDGDGGNIGKENYCGGVVNPRSPLFERGKLYEEYSVRRNERLKRKKRESGETGEEKKVAFGLGVRVESAKKRGVCSSARKKASVVPSTPVTERRENPNPNPRYLLRSMMSKENKKPATPLVSMMSSAAGKKTSVRSSRKF